MLQIFFPVNPKFIGNSESGRYEIAACSAAASLVTSILSDRDFHPEVRLFEVGKGYKYRNYFFSRRKLTTIFNRLKRMKTKIFVFFTLRRLRWNLKEQRKN